MNEYGNSFDYGDTPPFFDKRQNDPFNLGNASYADTETPTQEKEDIEILIRRVIQEELKRAITEVVEAMTNG